MIDYIDKEVAINTVFSMCCKWDTADPNDLKNMLLLSFQELVPSTDVVKVVRCKDCKYYNLFKNECNGICVLHIDAYRVFYPNDFCSYGERK